MRFAREVHLVELDYEEQEDRAGQNGLLGSNAPPDALEGKRFAKKDEDHNKIDHDQDAVSSKSRKHSDREEMSLGKSEGRPLARLPASPTP